MVAARGGAAASLDAVYRCGGSALGRVIAVCEPGADLRKAQDEHVDLVVLRNAAPGCTASWNLGLFLRQRDVLLLGDDVALTDGSLQEMLEVLHGSDRIASVLPLVGADLTVGDLRGIRRCTDLPTARGPSLLLRHEVLNMIGAFDPAFQRREDAEDDWSMRAQRMGFRHVRTNRALVTGREVPHTGPDAASTARLLARHPHLSEQIAAARLGAEEHAVEHFLAGQRGPLRVCSSLSAPGEPFERFQVLHCAAPLDDVAQLLAALETPCHLVLGEPGRYRDRAMLFAAAHSAQAVVAASAQERVALTAELALDPARVEVVESTADLQRVFRKVVDHPDMSSLRYRALLAGFLRSPPRSA